MLSVCPYILYIVFVVFPLSRASIHSSINLSSSSTWQMNGRKCIVSAWFLRSFLVDGSDVTLFPFFFFYFSSVHLLVYLRTV